MAEVNTAYNSIKDVYDKYSETTVSKSEAQKKASDKDMFLNLMIKQMQYQDPLSPQDNSEYLAQMAQFTTLEQMQNLSHSSEMNQATSLVGKTVKGYGASGKLIEGVADSVKVKSGTVYITVSGEDMELSKIQSVVEGKTTNTNYNNAIALVGKIVVGKDFEGVVDSVKNVDGEFKLVIGEKEVSTSEVTEVAELYPATYDILEHVAKLNTKIDSLISALEKITGVEVTDDTDTKTDIDDKTDVEKAE